MRAPERSGTVRINLYDDDPACRSAARITGQAAAQAVRFVYSCLLPGDDLVRTDARIESHGVRK
jgi:hypothetical protein